MTEIEDNKCDKIANTLLDAGVKDHDRFIGMCLLLSVEDHYIDEMIEWLKENPGIDEGEILVKACMIAGVEF